MIRSILNARLISKMNLGLAWPNKKNLSQKNLYKALLIKKTKHKNKRIW